MSVKEYKADLDMLTTADSGVRDLSKVRLFCVHTTENAAGTPPENVAKWQQNRANGSSYNGLIGTNGRTVRGNSDNYAPWSAGRTGNFIGYHWSLIGYASFTRAQWLQFPDQLNKLAEIIAWHHKKYGIPIRKLTADQVRNGSWGVCGHAEISAAFREVDHTDPGPNFPWDVVINKAKALATPATTKKETTVTKDNTQLILEQLAGPEGAKFTGWEQLGGRTLVDALGALGAHMGVPGFKDIKGQVKNKGA